VITGGETALPSQSALMAAFPRLGRVLPSATRRPLWPSKAFQAPAAGHTFLKPSFLGVTRSPSSRGQFALKITPLFTPRGTSSPHSTAADRAPTGPLHTKFLPRSAVGAHEALRISGSFSPRQIRPLRSLSEPAEPAATTVRDPPAARTVAPYRCCCFTTLVLGQREGARRCGRVDFVCVKHPSLAAQPAGPYRVALGVRLSGQASAWSFLKGAHTGSKFLCFDHIY